jgi:hypothetical protein
VSSDLHDLDDLAALWAEEPSLNERSELCALAQRVSWRATLFQYWDAGLGVAIAAAVLLAILARPAPLTLAIGLIAAAGVLWSTRKRHLLKKRVALLLRVSERTKFLDLEIRRVKTDLHLALVGLSASPLAILLFGMLTHSFDQGGSLAGFGQAVAEKLTDGLIGPALMAAMLTVIIQQVQIVRGLRSELRRLVALSDEYREEAQLDRLTVG